MHVQRVRIFLSSPGDVVAERQSAMLVFSRLQNDPFLRDRVSIQEVAWDAPGKGAPLLATMTPQQAINFGMRLPSECDLVTVIIGGRLGTPLPSTMLKPDGSRYRSGTEWEFLNAIEGFRRQGRPHVLVYRRIGLPVPADNDLEAIEQLRLVDLFFKELLEASNPDGSLPCGFNSYRSAGEFEQRYDYDLRVLLLRLLQERDSAEPAQPSNRSTFPSSSANDGSARTTVHVPRLSDLDFVGRDRDLDQLRAIFSQHPGRLVTVLGAGGLGKTRLACELAERLADLYPGGCYFVGLSDQETGEGVATQVGDVLGERLANKGDPSVLIAERIRHRAPTLFVLDNFEHLTEHAEATVGLWRRAAPGMGWLVTSRAVLGLDDEFCFPLNPLTLPDSDGDLVGPEFLSRLSSNPAVRLFVDRARRRRPDFTLDSESAGPLVRICREMDGLPLPILLVAGRVNEFTVSELADELGDRFCLATSNRETLWETIDWSYQLLRPEERGAFLQACIFRDGFSREAFREVIRLPGDDGASRQRIDRILQRLCDYSLINTERRMEQTRFRLYRSVQDFGRRMWSGDRNRLEPTDPPADLARRWVSYFVSYAERVSGRLPTLQVVEALEDLVIERENILEAHQWALGHGETDAASRLLLAFSPALGIRGPWQGRAERITQTCRQVGTEEVARPLRVRLLAQLTEACWAVGDWKPARRYAQQAVDVASHLEGTTCQAEALTVLGWIECQLDVNRSPLVYLRQSLRICRRLRDARREAINLWIMAIYFKLRCHYSWANIALDRSIALLRELGDLAQLVRAVNNQGLVLWHSGQCEPALERFEEAERINRRLGDLRWVAGHLTNRGLVLTDLDRIDEANACFDEAERLHVSQGNRAWWAVNQGGRGYAAIIRGDMRGLDQVREGLETSRRVDARDDIAQFLGYLGYGLLRFGRTREAADALREAIALQREIRMRSNRRHWTNLVHLATAISSLSDVNVEFIQCVVNAERLAGRLGLGPSEPVRVLRDCWVALQDLKKRLGRLPAES
jgi:predicted ATPase